MQAMKRMKRCTCARWPRDGPKRSACYQNVKTEPSRTHPLRLQNELRRPQLHAGPDMTGRHP